MEIPEALRNQILQQGNVSAEDFRVFLESAAARAASDRDVKNKFTALAGKTCDLVCADADAAEAFRQAETNKARMATLLGSKVEAEVTEELKSVFSRRLTRAHKNHAIVREEGTFYFKKEDYKHALNLYSTALKLALVPPPALHEWKVVTETPQGIVTETVVMGGADDGGSAGGGGGEGGGEGGEVVNSRDVEAAICLGQRSAVHYQTRDYDACIQDIDSALWFGAPQGLEKRLEDRRETCVSKMNKKWGGLAKSASEHKGNAQSKGITFQNLADFEESDKDRLLSQYLEFCPAGEKGTDKRGRRAVARVAIEAGEILVVERPLVSCLSFSSSADNCHYCCRPLNFKTFLPSPLEEGVLLCSWGCLENAMDGFHAWESKVNLCRLFEVHAEHEDKDREAKTKFDEISGTSILALRTILAHPIEEWVEVDKDLDKPKEKEGVKKQSVPRRDLAALAAKTSMISLLPSTSTKAKPHKEEEETFETAEKKMKLFRSLTSHSEDRNWRDRLFLCARSLLLVKFLEEIGYLDDDKSDEARLAVSAFLVSFMESIQYNTHDLSQLTPTGGDVEGIGCALYPVPARFLNHSCDPNTLRVTCGNNLVVVARRDIAQGEEVTDGYGPHFHKDEKEQRSDKLRKDYNFVCQCEACSKDYPTLRTLEGDLTPGQANQLEGTHRQLKEALASKRNRKEEQVLQKLRQYQSQLKDYKLRYPHRSHGVLGALVGSAYWQLVGNKREQNN